MLELPTEVWERIIDHLWEDHPELVACSVVCKAWYPRSRFHLLSRVILHSRADVYRLGRSLKSIYGVREEVHTLIVRGDPSEATRKPIPQLATLAAAFAGNPPQSEELGIWYTSLKRDLMHHVFLHLTSFTFITKLTLVHVTFPNILTFGHLLFAFSNLETLACRDISFEKSHLPVAFYTRPTNILDFDMLCGTPMDEVVDFLVTTACVARGLEQLHVAWWDPAPHLKELKALRVNSLLQAASDSLVVFDIRLAGVDLDQKPWRQQELDLRFNTYLSEIRLTLQVPPVPPEGIVVNPCTWLHTLLTTITSKELAYLTLEFDIRALAPGTDSPATLDMISSLLNSELSSAIDTLLAKEQFQNLESVYFGVFCAPQVVLADEEYWSLIMHTRFPKLKARGILHASVDIDLER